MSVRLCLFGGTFDPIHNAHLEIARRAADRFSLDRVLFIPAACPPHKQGFAAASFEDRYEMVELACKADARFLPSRLEAGENKSYSIFTIEKLSSPENKLFFLIGSDAFAEITTWFRWQDVVPLTDFIVVTRPGHTYAVPEGARVHRLDDIALPVSSSDIRRRIAQGEIPTELPSEVAAYIAHHGLYSRE